MGRIYEALRKAEQERRFSAAGRPEPAVVVDLAAPVGREPGHAAEPAAADVPATPKAPGVVGARVEAAAALAPDPSLVVVADPASAAAEHFRAIRVRLLRVLEAQDRRTLLVTSPGRGDGKTLTASNLALSLATDAGRRVLLVDADLRKPSLGPLFGAARGPGLADVVLGRCEWRRCTGKAPWTELHVMPAGERIEGAADRLSHAATRAFFQEARAAYDIVVIDAPPVLAVADAAVLAGLADAVVLVARAGHTPREGIVEAIGALSHANVIGAVLNGTPVPALGQRGYYSY